MPIHPLPQFEADLKVHLDEEDRKAYAALQPPASMVVRFGMMKLVGEFPYNGSVKPGCGSKLVVRTLRGTELGEMLTTTCANSGCSKSVSRKEMLTYIQNSGGRDYPFYSEGRVLRVAGPADLESQTRLEQSRHGLRLQAKEIAERLGIPVKIVDAEPILGGETLTFYYLSEERIELRDLIGELASAFRTHVELRHVGARDEARLTADYERCGQYCCCKNFLKVLKPVSMKSAKVQKATLDPLKISGRCGRLMCCLRYEDQTYEELKKSLPRKKSRVGTPEGDGTVIDGQILTQLVLVRLDALGTDGKFQDVAVPVENLSAPVNKVAPELPPMRDPTEMRGVSPVRRVNLPRKPQATEPTDEAGLSSQEPRRSPEESRGPHATPGSDASGQARGPQEDSAESGRKHQRPRESQGPSQGPPDRSGGGKRRRSEQGHGDRSGRREGPREARPAPRDGSRPGPGAGNDGRGGDQGPPQTGPIGRADSPVGRADHGRAPPRTQQGPNAPRPPQDGGGMPRKDGGEDRGPRRRRKRRRGGGPGGPSRDGGPPPQPPR